MTVSISLESFHDSFDKHINLVSSFTDKPEVSKIIRICRMKPYDIIFKAYDEKIILHHHWIDEHGNSLFIGKNKSLKIQLNNLNIDKSKVVNTDIYEKLSMDKISGISKFIFFLHGKEEDFNSDHTVLSFVGIDNYLRTFMLSYGEWVACPSLTIGIKALTEIAMNQDLKFFKEIKLRSPAIYPCTTQRAWLSSWYSKDFASIMGQQNDSVLTILKLNKGNVLNNAYRET